MKTILLQEEITDGLAATWIIDKYSGIVDLFNQLLGVADWLQRLKNAESP